MSNQQDANLTPTLPLTKDDELEYKHVDNYADLIRQNFKNLLLTIPGERVMDVDLGIGVQRFLFENPSSATSSIKTETIQKTKRYMPFVKISNVMVEAGSDEQTLIVRIFYSVPSMAIEEYNNLSFDSDGSIIS